MAAYSERFSLPFLAQVVIAAAERKRPGLGALTAEAEAQLRRTFAEELAELKRRFFEIFDDTVYWAKVEQTMMEVCLPRYVAEARRFSDLEQRDFGAWRGGDLVARLTYALGGFVLGAALVRAPFLPIPKSWDALIFGLAILAPFLPDAQGWLHRRRHARRLKGIVDGAREVEAQLKLYPQLSPANPMPVESVESSSVSSQNPALAQADRAGQKG